MYRASVFIVAGTARAEKIMRSGLWLAMRHQILSTHIHIDDDSGLWSSAVDSKKASPATLMCLRDGFVNNGVAFSLTAAT
ncbi:hypothetical protein I9W82_003966 [Candida metapsilosis]|uniref:Uncharacterized protein n=1 Tax=Candida metapsilosis TaxID=273372 RepID=A0A8H7ZAT9_9ASCO|nr:hypothetical protein I9W82_003966 [Candida metapsilosis]